MKSCDQIEMCFELKKAISSEVDKVPFRDFDMCDGDIVLLLDEKEELYLLPERIFWRVLEIMKKYTKEEE